MVTLRLSFQFVVMLLLISAIDHDRTILPALANIPPSVIRDVDAGAVLDQCPHKLYVKQKFMLGHQFVIPHDNDAVLAVVVIDFGQEPSHPLELFQPSQLLHLQCGVINTLVTVPISIQRELHHERTALYF